MQLLVQNCLDPCRATEIFSVPKRRIFALPKIVRYRNKSGLQIWKPFNCFVLFNLKKALVSGPKRRIQVSEWLEMREWKMTAV